jgi:hypothetical protein
MKRRLGRWGGELLHTTVEPGHDTKTPIAPPDGVLVCDDNKRDWLGPLIFGLLMVYPLVAQYIPTGVREYLSITLK